MQDIIERFEKFIRDNGPWAYHNIEYAPGCFTATDDTEQQADIFAAWLETIIGKPLNKCKILDLGCLEGGHSYYLAQKGAQVTGVEVRQENFKRCSFLQSAFPELKIDFILADVTQVSMDTLGQYDGILMAGLLYHLDAPDLLPVLKNLRTIAPALIMEGHLAMRALEKYQDPQTNLTLYGRTFWEHNEAKELAKREKDHLSSYKNHFSFWLTEHSLVNLFKAAGYNMAAKIYTPSLISEEGDQDRSLWVARASEAKFAQPVPNLPDPDHRPLEIKLLQGSHKWPQNPATEKI